MPLCVVVVTFISLDWLFAIPEFNEANEKRRSYFSFYFIETYI